VVKARFTTDGRIGDVLVVGNKLKANVVENVLKADVSMSSSEVTQLRLSIREDEDFTLTKSGLFVAGSPTTTGSAITYGDLEFEVRAIDIAPRGTDHALDVTARSWGAGILRRQRGARVRRNLSPTDYAALAAKSADLEFVGQPTGKRKAIPRQKNDSEWQTLQRLASEIGGVCFEAAGVLYFGQPTYLIEHTEQVVVDWKGKDTDESIDALPTCRRSGDDEKGLATVSVPMRGPVSEQARPGMSMPLSGIPKFEGRYMVTDVNMSLADGSPVVVSAATAINPDKAPVTTLAKKVKRVTIGTTPIPGLPGAPGTAPGTPPPSGSGGRVWPANTHALSGNYPGHSGVDIAAGSGTPIKAASDGTVEYVGWGRGFGQAIFIRGVGGELQVYGHSSKLQTKAGARVSAGQQIGLVGMTGNATGPHLHFEIAASAPGSVGNRGVTLAWLKSAK
jgi:murein DD-endopeptidase MepM/ murein hydrolase activator NlpD